jgi:hypothetical protein
MSNPMDLTEQFAAEMGLSVDQLRCTAPSPRATEDQHYVYHANLQKNIANILVTQGGAFSNSLIQLANAINLALRLNIQNIYLSSTYVHPDGVHPTKNGRPFWYIKPGKHEYAEGKYLINEGFETDDLVGATIAGEFFHLDAFYPIFSHYYPLAHLLVKPFLGLNLNKYVFGELDLVLYLRSGTAFWPNPNCGFSQPPLSFYKLIIDSRRWESLTVVYEDTLNPVILPLVEYCKTKSVPVRQISGDLERDIEVLLSAKVLTLSRGTFPSGVISISDNVKVVYDFAGTYGTLKRDDISVIQVCDTKGAYMDALYRMNWADSEDQRRMMVEYEDVAFVQS